MTVTEFTVVRHGQTAENKSGILQGHLDTDLDQQGHAQIAAAAAMLKGEKFDLIVHSDLRRAVQSAEIIATLVDAPMLPEKRLREWFLGDLEGGLCADLQLSHPEIMNAFKYPVRGDIVVPGGESWSEFSARIADFLHDTARTCAGKRLLLVTHGGVLRIMYTMLCGTPPALSVQPRITNAGITKFSCLDELWQLQTWNEITHLRRVGCRQSITF